MYTKSLVRAADSDGLESRDAELEAMDTGCGRFITARRKAEAEGRLEKARLKIARGLNS
jgi:hypothetical protein